MFLLEGGGIRPRLMETTITKKSQYAKESGSTAYMWVYFALYLLYGYQTVLNSSLVGNAEADRTSVYVALGLLIAVSAVPVVFGSRLPRGSWVSRWLWAMFAWILFVDVARGTDAWWFTVHLGLAAWWAVTYSFMARVSLWNQRGSQLIPRAMLVFLFMYVAATFYSAFAMSQRVIVQEVVVGTVYFVVASALFLAISPSVFVRLVGIVAVFVAVGFSNKRGAVVAMVLMLAAAGFVYLRCGRFRPKQWFGLVLVTLLMGISLWFFNRRTDGFLAQRFSSESLSAGSGRPEFYRVILAAVQESSLDFKLIGGGTRTAYDLVGTAAHNDWLEFQSGLGIVGVFIYAGFVCSVAATAYRYLRCGQTEWAAAVGAALMLILAQSLYSYFWYAHSTYFVIALLGYLRGLELLRQEQNVSPNSRSVESQHGLDSMALR